MNEKRQFPHEPDPPQQYESPIRSVVTITRPRREELSRYSRAEKYRMLREYSARMRNQLMEWINQRGLSSEVVQVSEPTVFNTLFMVATRHATELIARAPGVVRVEEDGDITTDLPYPHRRD